MGSSSISPCNLLCGCHSLTAFPQTTLRKCWKISAALSGAMTFHFSNRQTVYKSYFIMFVVFLVYRFCLISVMCRDSVLFLFLCSQKAEYSRLGREREAICQWIKQVAAINQLVSLLFTTFSVSLTWAMERIDPPSPPPPSIIPPDPSMHSFLMIHLIVAPLKTFVSHFLYLPLPFFSLKQLPPQLITFTHPSLHLLFPFMRHFQ